MSIHDPSLRERRGADAEDPQAEREAPQPLTWARPEPPAFVAGETPDAVAREEAPKDFRALLARLDVDEGRAPQPHHQQLGQHVGSYPAHPAYGLPVAPPPPPYAAPPAVPSPPAPSSPSQPPPSALSANAPAAAAATVATFTPAMPPVSIPYPPPHPLPAQPMPMARASAGHVRMLGPARTPEENARLLGYGAMESGAMPVPFVPPQVPTAPPIVQTPPPSPHGAGYMPPPPLAPNDSVLPPPQAPVLPTFSGAFAPPPPPPPVVLDPVPDTPEQILKSMRMLAVVGIFASLVVPPLGLAFGYYAINGARANAGAPGATSTLATGAVAMVVGGLASLVMLWLLILLFF